MKTKTKLSIQWIAMTGAIMLCVLYSDTTLYANHPYESSIVKHNSAKISKQVNKIIKYSELLKNADTKKAESIQRRIDNSQAKIRVWQDQLYSEVNVNKHQAMTLPFIKYDFDAAENSLVLNQFRAKRIGEMDEFHLGFKTKETGPARIDIISPGGELLKSISQSDYTGSFRKEFNLSAEKGKVYFVHIEVDGKKTTKKLHFE